MKQVMNIFVTEPERHLPHHPNDSRIIWAHR